MYIIYLVTNAVTGDQYVGMTKVGLSLRKRQHLWSSNGKKPGSCRRFHRALRKYGAANFSWTVVRSDLSAADACAAEIELIAQLKPAYNITSGGYGMVGIPRTREWIEKAAKSNRGKKRSAEIVEKIRLASSAPRKPVTCLNDGRSFGGAEEAARYYRIRARDVRNVCSGAQAKTGDALSFCYVKTSLSIGELAEKRAATKDRIEAEKARRSAGFRHKMVVRSDGAVFESALKAAAASNISHMRVSQLCRFGGSTRSGYSFKYEGEQQHPPMPRSEEEMLLSKVKRLAALERGQSKLRKGVLCREFDVVFPSISDAARSIGRRVSTLSASIYRKGKCDGFEFEFASRS